LTLTPFQWSVWVLRWSTDGKTALCPHYFKLICKWKPVFF
jgi:hypothetical protein